MKKNTKSIISCFLFELNSFIIAAFLVVCIFLSSVSYAAVLNVDLDVRTRAVEGDPVYQRKNIAIFVLDRSGSMTTDAIGKNAGKKLSRNDQLVASVKDRIQILSDTCPSTQVYFLPFSGSIGRMMGPYSLDSKLDKKAALEWGGFDKTNCFGITFLYDTLAYALDFAEGLIQSDPKVKVQVYGYTDGANYTAGNEKVRNNNINASWVKVRYPTNNEYSKQECDRAYQKFFDKYGKKIEQFIVAGKMDDIQWRWLGAGDPPKGIGNIRRDEYRLVFSSDSSALKNPSSVAEQTMKASLVIPIPAECEKDLSGMTAKIILDVNGKKEDTVMSLAPGKKTVSFQIPEGMKSGQFKGKLSFTDIPDKWERILLKAPAPLEINFSAPDKLSFVSVEPKGEVYTKIGDKIDFSAKASDGAAVAWNIDGNDRGQNSISFSFDQVGDHLAKATAKKAGFEEVSESVKVHVIDARVAVQAISSKPTVGEPVDFAAQAKGSPEDFSWWVDGQPVSGQGKALKGQIFDSSGKHAVKVRASYGHGISAESPEFTFEVAAKPRLTIVEPIPGSEYEFGQKIECLANVEGDFDKVEWKITGPLTETEEASVIKDKRISNSAFFKPVKGGEYTLSATANGSAGNIEATTKVKFKVAREDLGVKITSHSSGSTINLGPDAQNPDLIAEVKGDAIKQVKWTMWNTKSGTKSDIRTTPVQDGEAKCACPNDAAIGDGVGLVIQAEAVMPEGEEPVVSAPIELVSRLVAEMDVEAKVNGNEANGREVRFGDQVDLVAVCKGDIDPAQVKWYKSVDGEESEIGIGHKCSSPKENPNGDDLRTVRYFAKAKLSDGSFKTSREIIVHHSCSCSDFTPTIKLPQKDGITKTAFSLREEVNAELEGAKLTDVVWDMGDGTICTNLVASHFYSKHGTNTIRATGKCPNCHKEYSVSSVEIRIEHKPPIARFSICKSTANIKPAGSWIPRKWTVAIVSDCEGDVAGLHWYLDDVLLTNYDNKATFEYDCDTVGKHEFRLVAFDLAGNESKDTHSVHVYRLLLVIVLVILALAGIICLWYLWSYDDPRFWKLFVIASEDNSLDERSALEAMPTSGKSIMQYWETWNNRALIPLHKLGGRLSSEEWKKGTLNGDAKLCLQESQHARSEGDKRDRDPQATLQESAPDMLMQVYNSGRLLRITAIPRESQKTLTALWIKIDTSKKGANNAYLWYRLGTMVLIIGIVTVLIAMFAA